MATMLEESSISQISDEHEEGEISDDDDESNNNQDRIDLSYTASASGRSEVFNDPVSGLGNSLDNSRGLSSLQNFALAARSTNQSDEIDKSAKKDSGHSPLATSTIEVQTGGNVGLQKSEVLEEKVQTVIKLINNVTVGNACKSLNDACSQLYDALVILQELPPATLGPSKESVPSLVSQVVDRIRVAYCVYNATGESQKPRVFQSLIKLASLYAEKLFTPNQLQELKVLSQTLKETQEQYSEKNDGEVSPQTTSGTISPMPAYLPWDGAIPLVRGDSEDELAPSSSDPLVSYSSYVSSSLTLDDLPSPTPSDDDEAARFGRKVTATASDTPQLLSSSKADDKLISQPLVLKSRDPRRNLISLSTGVEVSTLNGGGTQADANTKKREAFENILQPVTGSKRQRLIPEEDMASFPASGSGGWLDPDVNEGPSEMESEANEELKLPENCVSENAQQIMMKPRDPRRALLDNVKPSNGVNTVKPQESVVQLPFSSQKGTVLNIPIHLMQKLRSLVEMVGNTNGGVITGCPHDKVEPKIDDLARMLSDAGNPSVQTNGSILDSPNQEEATHYSQLHPELQEILNGLDENERIAFIKERQRRIDEQEEMLNAKKLCLVLDLDHTLLNSAKFGEVEPEWDQYLRATEAMERNRDGRDGFPRRELYRFPHMAMWTKLRPGIWRFLARASQLYELHLYTMGNKAYATEMAKLLDPTGHMFAGRVISKGDDGVAVYGDDKIPRSKDLDGVLGMESAVLIIDDSTRVWPHHRDNLIVVERYMYFPSSRRQFGLPGPSLLEVGHDEREADGMLASALGVIERVHLNFFSRPHLNEVDVREVLAMEQRRVLEGCKIIFSRIFPVGETQPQLHPLWRMAEQFGAVCTAMIEEDVTHVVALSMGTDKVNWALATGRHLVRPAWLEASTILYRRANERDFPVPL